jgi:hypothetical protein
MDENLFKRRTKQLALRVIKAVESLPKNRTAIVRKKTVKKKIIGLALCSLLLAPCFPVLAQQSK